MNTGIERGVYMSKYKIDTFNIIGIQVRTSNENGQAAKDISELWHRFMSEGFLDKIENKVDNTIYCVYTEYESDYTKPYTTVLGCKVDSVDSIPEGMVVETIQSGEYKKFVAKGNLMEGVLYKKWSDIFNTDLDRVYKTDFEVYTEKAKNPADAEVDIFVGVKEEIK